MKFGSPRLALSLTLLAAFSVLLTLSHAYHGTATSMDSITYINVAKSIAEGKGVVVPNYELAGENFSPMTMWPPLYPALLSTLCTGSECIAPRVRELSIYLNVLLLLGSSLIFFTLANKLVNTWLALASTLSLLLLPAFQITFMFLWSETVFIPLILLSFYCLTRYIENTKSLTMLTSAVVLMVFATYTRYVGVAFALALLASLLLFSPDGYPKRIKTLLTSGLLYSLLIGPLLLRNFTHTGHLSGGERGTPSLRLEEDSIRLIDLIAQELFSAQPLLLASWILVVCALIMIRNYRSVGITQPQIQASAHHLYMPLLWSFIYIGFLLISRSVQQVDLDTRMLSVILPLLLLGVIALVNFLSRNLPLTLSTLPLIFIMLLAALSGLACHQTILANLRTEQSPGYVHHMRYYSITEPRFDAFRDIAQTFDIGSGDIVLTDSPRPQTLNYFFGDATVKSIPYLDGKVDFQALASLKEKRLLGIIYRPDLNKELMLDYPGDPALIRATHIKNPDTQFLFVEFPEP